MSVAEDCATIRAALPDLVSLLDLRGRPVPERWDDGDPARRRWRIPTRLKDGRLVRIDVKAAGGGGRIIVAVGVSDGRIWHERRVRWRVHRQRPAPNALARAVCDHLDDLDHMEWRTRPRRPETRESLTHEPDDCSDCWTPVEAVQP